MVIVSDTLYEGGVSMDVTGFEVEVKHTGLGLGPYAPLSSDLTRTPTEVLLKDTLLLLVLLTTAISR